MYVRRARAHDIADVFVKILFNAIPPFFSLYNHYIGFKKYSFSFCLCRC